MQTVHTVADLRDILRPLREAGQRIAFVPTMGNLHEGHIELVRQAKGLAGQVVVSIFVNPMQFNDKRDFDAYPITIEEDNRKLDEVDANILFIPGSNEVYPEGMERSTRVVVPGVSDILCGHYRPGHFVGVATVVAKLFNIVQPHVAIFGEKDYQQLLVIRRMVADLCMPIEIVGAKTIREPDGLAMSSRNSYLTAQERVLAPLLYRTLQAVSERLVRGEDDYRMIEAAAADALNRSGFKPEYVAIRRADDLEEPVKGDRRLIVLAAAWLGSARLIDNLLIK